jgi:hypothetical protein
MSNDPTPVARRPAPYEIEQELRERAERRRAGTSLVAGGIFLAAVGGAVTILSHGAASSGGMYVVMYGPIVGGALMFVRGLRWMM